MGRNHVHALLVTAVAASLAVLTAATAGAGVNDFQPNGVVRKPPNGLYKGTIVVSDNPHSQRITDKVPPGGTAKFEIAVENLDDATQTYNFAGGGSLPKFKMTYTQNGIDITADAVAGTAQFDPLPGFEVSDPIKAKVKVKGTVVPGSTYSSEVIVYHISNANAFDDHLKLRVKVV